VKHRKKFFDRFAERNEFDPLVTRNWYNTAHKIRLVKVIMEERERTSKNYE
jgi:hypothetical protein